MDATTGTTTTTGAGASTLVIPDNQLTCNTCATKLDSKEAKREHMKGDWHVYNLKRRIASLSPVSFITFQENIVSPKTEDASSDDSCQVQGSGIPSEQFDTRRKTKRPRFKSRKQTRNFLESPSSQPEDSHSEDEDEEQFNPRQCLFCNAQTASLDANMAHMSHAHSFFIPNAEYLISLESLLSYLFIILSDFHECLYCGSVKSNKFAVQDHMRGKGHCKVDIEDEGHGLKQFYDFSGDTDSDEESQDPEEDLTVVPEDDELRLPSGKTLGHRSRARYFRQKVPAGESSRSPSRFLVEEKAEELPAEEAQSTDRRIVMRAGTSTSMIGIPEAQRRALVAVEQKMMKIEARTRNEYEANVQRKANRQKRFRVKSIGKKAGGLEKRLG